MHNGTLDAVEASKCLEGEPLLIMSRRTMIHVGRKLACHRNIKVASRAWRTIVRTQMRWYVHIIIQETTRNVTSSKGKDSPIMIVRTKISAYRQPGGHCTIDYISRACTKTMLIQRHRYMHRGTSDALAVSRPLEWQSNRSLSKTVRILACE